MFSAAVSHFLNCLLGSSSFLPDTSSAEPPTRRRSRRRRPQPSRVPSSKDSGWTKLTPSELWSRIRKEAQDYYHHTTDGFVYLCFVCLLPDASTEISSPSNSVCSESLDEVLEKRGLQKISLLREIAIKTGIQVGHQPETKLNQKCCLTRHTSH